MSAFRAGMTLRGAVVAATQALLQAGVEDAAGDARRLVADAAGGDALVLIREPERALGADEAAKLASMIMRRSGREPVSRILGWREFYGQRFAISPDVLDPRADTETVVEAVLGICQHEGWRDRPVRILDLGTGSGCILLALLTELRNATGVGLDISKRALDMARANAEALHLGGRTDFRHGDMRVAELAGFDLVVSNPPYIASGDLAGLDPDVALFDPPAALDGGQDGLAFYRDILSQALKPHPGAGSPQWIVLEAGIGQAGEITEFARKIGLIPQTAEPLIRNDLNGVARVVALKTRS